MLNFAHEKEHRRNDANNLLRKKCCETQGHKSILIWIAIKRIRSSLHFFPNSLRAAPCAIILLKTLLQNY